MKLQQKLRTKDEILLNKYTESVNKSSKKMKQNKGAIILSSISALAENN